MNPYADIHFQEKTCPGCEGRRTVPCDRCDAVGHLIVVDGIETLPPAPRTLARRTVEVTGLAFERLRRLESDLGTERWARQRAERQHVEAETAHALELRIHADDHGIHVLLAVGCTLTAVLIAIAIGVNV